MSTANFDDGVELLSLLGKALVKSLQTREQALVDFGGYGNVHGSRETNGSISRSSNSEYSDIRIVGRLAHVHVIVRMYRFLAAQHTTQHFNSTIRNDFL